MNFTPESVLEHKGCHSVNDYWMYVPNYNNKLTCIHVNIRSIIKNFSQIEVLVKSSLHRIDIIILTEVGISNNNLRNMFTIPGYTMHTKLRSNKKGGGIIMYVLNEHKFEKLTLKTSLFECIVGNLITCNNYTIALCAIYRPPSLNKSLFLIELKHTLDKCQNIDLILLGDININLKERNKHTSQYLDTVSEYGLVCGISDYTRIESKNSIITKSCIDHIFVRSRTQEVHCAALATVLADHCVTVTTLGMDHSSGVQFAPLNIIKYNDKVLFECLDAIDWTPTYYMNDANNIYDYFKDKLINCYESAKYIDSGFNKKKRKQEGWVNSKIIDMCKCRDKKFLEMKKDITNSILRLEYNKYRNKVNKKIQKYKNKYYKDMINKNKSNPKLLWQILNKMTGRIVTSVDDVVRKAFSNNITDDRKIADNFDFNFTQSVRKTIHNCSISLLNKNEYSNNSDVSMFIRKAQPKDILNIIKKLHVNKAAGIDKIRPIDIKTIAQKFAKAIAHFINTSISTGTYPSQLKSGIVRPIYKKGNKKDYDSYRPITILPVLDKICEKYISKEIHTFYNKNNILSCDQYGFQANKSTTLLLSNFTDFINDCLNKKEHIIVIFIDYSKAFDTLQHNLLLQKLENSGIRGPLLEWCSSYLKDRTCCVRIGNDYSRMSLVKQGTAQGSVLGPLYYLAYVNDAKNIVRNCKMYQYADDTCIVAHDRNYESALGKLTDDFASISKWSHDNGLVLNASKSKVMHIHSSHIITTKNVEIKSHNYQCLHIDIVTQNCNCAMLEQVSQFTYLGLVIDDRFNWKYHTANVCQKLRAVMAKMTIVNNRVPYHIKLLMYNALVESIISYGLSSYGRTFKTYTDQINKLQLRILKTIVPSAIKVKYKNNPNYLFQYCKVLPIQEKIKLVLIKENYFKYIGNERQSCVFTRQIAQKKLCTISASNFYGKRTTNYIVPRLINDNLNIDIRDKITNFNIKRILKTVFLPNNNDGWHPFQ